MLSVSANWLTIMEKSGRIFGSSSQQNFRRNFQACRQLFWNHQPQGLASCLVDHLQTSLCAKFQLKQQHRVIFRVMASNVEFDLHGHGGDILVSRLLLEYLCRQDCKAARGSSSGLQWVYKATSALTMHTYLYTSVGSP